jgi:hypothetical protein
MDELTNIDELENQGSMDSDLNISNVYSVRKGGFGVSSFINTYLSTLSVLALTEDVQFYETLSADKDWPVSQIIQREVDQERVNLIAKKYLLGAGRTVKYFPPIIVALLPRELDGSFAKEYNFTPDDSNMAKNLILDKSIYRNNQEFRTLTLKKTNESLVDGLYNYNTSAIFEHNLLCWDKNKFFAVVIDGQHRLDALIKSGNEDHMYKQALQDVLFLDVSPLVQQKSTFTPVEILRTIFIDINTNAKSVGLVRRILMDDKDLASLCVQSLVESINKDGTSKEDDEFIPSTLIDWYGESIKHELPHLTGLITLHQILTDQLVEKKLVSIEDHRDTNKINSFIGTMNQNFFVDQTIKNDADYQDVKTLEKSFSEYLSDKEINREIFAQEFNDGLDSILFTYDYRVLEVAQKNFEKFYLKSMIKILINTIPYTEVISSLSDKGGFDPQNNLYRSLLLPVKKIRAKENLRNAYLDARRTLSEQVNPRYFLFYSVVGQKGLFYAFFELLDQKFVEGSDVQTVVDTQTKFTDDLNDVLNFLSAKEVNLFGNDPLVVPQSAAFEQYGTVSSSFWEGILYENDRIIYNSQGVRAFADILKLLVILNERRKGGIEMESLVSTQIRFSSIRTKRLLNKNIGVRTDEEWDAVSQLILISKKEYLISLFK